MKGIGEDNMNEIMLAKAIIDQREADYLRSSYQREWREMHAIERLERNLKRRRGRLAMHYRLIRDPAAG